jgi:hypothetical protein
MDLSTTPADVAAPPRKAAMASDGVPRGELVETDIPARLDALPWARFHTLMDYSVTLDNVTKNNLTAGNFHFT